MPSGTTKAPPITPVLQSQGSSPALLHPWRTADPWRRKGGLWHRSSRSLAAARGEQQPTDTPLVTLAAAEGHQQFLGTGSHAHTLLPSPREEDEEEPDPMPLLSSVGAESTLEGKLRKMLVVHGSVQRLLLQEQSEPQQDGGAPSSSSSAATPSAAPPGRTTSAVSMSSRKTDTLEHMTSLLMQELLSKAPAGASLSEDTGDAATGGTGSAPSGAAQAAEVGAGTGDAIPTEAFFSELQVLASDIIADLCDLDVEVVGSRVWSICRGYLEDVTSWHRCLHGLELLTHISPQFSTWLLQSTDAIMWLVRVLTDSQQHISQQREATLSATGRSTAGQTASRFGPFRASVDVFPSPPPSLSTRLPGKLRSAAESALNDEFSMVPTGGCSSSSARPMRVPPLNLATRLPGSSTVGGASCGSPARRAQSSMTRSSRRLRLMKAAEARDLPPAAPCPGGASIPALGQRSPHSRLSTRQNVVPGLRILGGGGPAMSSSSPATSPAASPHAPILSRAVSSNQVAAPSAKASIQQAEDLAKAMGEACLLADLSHLIKYKQERQIQEAVIDSIRPGVLSPSGVGTGRAEAAPGGTSTASHTPEPPCASGEPDSPAAATGGPAAMGTPPSGLRTAPILNGSRLPGMVPFSGLGASPGDKGASSSASGQTANEVRGFRHTAFRQARLHACLVLEQFAMTTPEPTKFVGPHVPVNKFFEMLQGSCGRTGVCSFAVDDDLDSEARLLGTGTSSSPSSSSTAPADPPQQLRGILQRLMPARTQRLLVLHERLQQSTTSSRCVCGASALGARSRSGTVDDVCTCVDDVLAASIWRLLGTRAQYVERLLAPKVLAPCFDVNGSGHFQEKEHWPWEKMSGAWQIRLALDGFLTRVSRILAPLLTQLRSAHGRAAAGPEAVAAWQYRLSFHLRLTAAYLRRTRSRSLELHAFHVLSPSMMMLKAYLCSSTELEGQPRLSASEAQLWVSYLQLVGVMLAGGVRSGADFSLDFGTALLNGLLDFPEAAKASATAAIGGAASTTVAASGLQSTAGASSASLTSASAQLPGAARATPPSMPRGAGAAAHASRVVKSQSLKSLHGQHGGPPPRLPTAGCAIANATANSSLVSSPPATERQAPAPPKGMAELLPRILERTVCDSTFEDSLAGKPRPSGGAEDSAETIRCRAFYFVESLLAFCQALLRSHGDSDRDPGLAAEQTDGEEEEAWLWSRRSGSPSNRMLFEEVGTSTARSPSRRFRSSSAGSLGAASGAAPTGRLRVQRQGEADALAVSLLDWLQFLFLPPHGLLCRAALKVPLTGSALGTRLVLCEKLLFSIPAVDCTAYIRQQFVADYYVRRHFLAFVRLYNSRATKPDYDRRLSRVCCLHLQTLLAIASLKVEAEAPRRAFHQLSVIEFLVGEVDLEHETSQMHERFLRTAPHRSSSAGTCSSNAGSCLSSPARAAAAPPVRLGGSLLQTPVVHVAPAGGAASGTNRSLPSSAASSVEGLRSQRDRALPATATFGSSAATPTSPCAQPQFFGGPKAALPSKVPKLQFKGLRPSLQGCSGLGAPPPEEPGLGEESHQFAATSAITSGTMAAVPETAAPSTEASQPLQTAEAPAAEEPDSSDEDEPPPPVNPAPALPQGPVLQPEQPDRGPVPKLNIGGVQPEKSAKVEDDSSDEEAELAGVESKLPKSNVATGGGVGNGSRAVPKLSFSGLQPKQPGTALPPSSSEQSGGSTAAPKEPAEADALDSSDEDLGAAAPQPMPVLQPGKLRAVPKLSFHGIRPSMQGSSGIGAPPPEEPGAYPEANANPPDAAATQPAPPSTTAPPFLPQVVTTPAPALSDCGEGPAMTPTVSHSSDCQSPGGNGTDTDQLSFKGVINQKIFYFTGRQRRRLYEDTELHSLVLTLILALLLLPRKGLLDKRYCDQYPLANHKRNIPFLLSLHLNHAANKTVLPALVRHVETIAHIGGLRVLKLLCEAAMHRWMYTDRTRIAGGSFGTVYQCSLPLGDPWVVAVKQIPKQTAIQDRCVFHDVFSEVVCLDTIRFEDSVCQLYDYGVDETGYWIVMRYYPTTLKKWRDSLKGTMSENLPALLAVFRQVLQAVQLLHSRSIVHYDLKCDNIMLDIRPIKHRSSSQDNSTSAGRAGVEAGPMKLHRVRSTTFDWASLATGVPRIAVADFGESLMLADDAELDTKNRGTELVKCPEMLELEKVGKREGDNYDRLRKVGTNRAADVWSVGCLLFELLTGRFLFQDDDFGIFWARVTGHMGNREDSDVISQANIALLEGNTPMVQLLRYIFVRNPTARPSIDQVADKFELFAAEAMLVAEAAIAKAGRRSDDGQGSLGFERPKSIARSESGSHFDAPRSDNALLCTAAGTGSTSLTNVLHNLSVLDIGTDDLSGTGIASQALTASVGVGGPSLTASALLGQHSERPQSLPWRSLLATNSWSHVVDCRAQGSETLPLQPEDVCRLQLPWAQHGRTVDELISFLPAIFDFLRHAAITRGVVLIVDSQDCSPVVMLSGAGVSEGMSNTAASRGGVAMGIVLAMVAEVYHMAVYPTLSYLSSQLLLAGIRPNLVASLAKWQDSIRSPVWKQADDGQVQVSCLCGACSWRLPIHWVTEAEHARGSNADLGDGALWTTCQCGGSSSSGDNAEGTRRVGQSGSLAAKCCSICPNRSNCESYAKWLQTHFNLSIEAVHWLFLPSSAGDGRSYSDGIHDGMCTGVLTRGLAVQAEPIPEEPRRISSSSTRTELHVQRYRCRICQVMSHVEVGVPGRLDGSTKRVALVLSYEQLRRSPVFEMLSATHGHQPMAIGHEAARTTGQVSRRPPESLQRTHLEELLLPQGRAVSETEDASQV